MSATAIAVDWHQVDLFVEQLSNPSLEALQVIGAVALLFVVALLKRTTVARPLPLIVVLVVATLVAGIPAMGSDGAVANMARDVLRMMIAPVLIFVAARWRPKLFAYRSS
jgi:hypothetical protein